ncbi:unnamed protein product [Closterium sp. Yama58-4]|nr:unnamed protein product [Closterium sp. Yama58-4]
MTPGTSLPLTREAEPLRRTEGESARESEKDAVCASGTQEPGDTRVTYPSSHSHTGLPALSKRHVPTVAHGFWSGERPQKAEQAAGGRWGWRAQMKEEEREEGGEEVGEGKERQLERRERVLGQ